MEGAITGVGAGAGAAAGNPLGLVTEVAKTVSNVTKTINQTKENNKMDGEIKAAAREFAELMKCNNSKRTTGVTGVTRMATTTINM